MRHTPTPVGSQRILRKFAWFPMSIGGTWFWLEHYEVKQILEVVYVPAIAGLYVSSLMIPLKKWRTHEWHLPKKEKK